MATAPTPTRVLVVDDSPDTADTTVALLRYAGCEAVACYDGPTALAEAARFRPSVCLLDLAMPGMDGDRLARAIREHAVANGWAVPLLVAVTSHADGESRRRTAAAGCAIHLVKPVAASDLVAVTSALDQ